MRTVLVLNGPNLSRLGSREPDVYGTASLDELQRACATTAAELGLLVDFQQTDDEAERLAWVHEAAGRRVPAVLNPAAFTPYS
jgi:3-dehydroquinate dehydratase II